MTFEMATVIVVIALAVVLFVTEKVPVDLVALMAMGCLMALRILSPEEAISGFSNPATVTVAAMFILSAGLFKTGAVNPLGTALAKLARRNFWLALSALMVTVGAISAFINNTAAVAVFLPIVLGAARQANVSPSKLLMPLSFASMFGGVCTLIGTSTNILVSSIAVRHGQPPFEMFEFSSLGILFFVSGTLYMLFAGAYLIPGRRVVSELTEEFGMGDYLVEVVLMPEAKSVGKPLADCPLVKDLDIDIIEVSRKGNPVALPPSDTILHAQDVLRVRCNVAQIQRMQEREGVVLKPHVKWRDKELESEQAALVEAVIAPNSMLEGKSLKQIQFRNNFGATALALRHRGETMHEKLGTTRLRAGDVLLIEAPRGRMEQLKRNPAFVIVTQVGLPEYRKKKILPALIILTGVVLSATLNVMPIVTSAIIGCILLILTGCLHLEEAYQSIEWKVIFLLAGVLALGVALEKTGAAKLLSTLIVSSAGVPLTILSAFYLVTSLMTEVMSNNAAAALLAPIAIAAAESLGLNARPFLMAVTFAASASFMTPVGYQTNTLIYGPGWYRFSDFLRVGAPLNLLFWLISTVMIPRIWAL